MKTLGATMGVAGVIGSSSLLSSCAKIEANSGDKIKLLTSSGELVEVDKAQLKPADLPSLTENQKRGRLGLPGKSWVMVIDLSKCRNARQCMKACQNHHQLRPEQHHINVLQMQDVSSGVYKKLVIKDNVIKGAVMFGDTMDGTWYYSLMRDGTNIADFRKTILFGQHDLGDAGHGDDTRVMSLPDDAEQNMRLLYLEKYQEKAVDDIDILKLKVKELESCVNE